MAVLRPDLMMKCVIPVVMAGIIAVSPCPLQRAYIELYVDLWSRRLSFDFIRLYAFSPLLL